jgi:uncharacterized damage-inducible protein DinB
MQQLIINALAQDNRSENIELNQIRNLLTNLFKWNNDANQQFIATLTKDSIVPANCLNILSHIINVHELWINRITNVRNNEIQPWGKLGKIDISIKNANNYYVTLGLLASEGYGRNFTWTFNYLNEEGMLISSTLMDAYIHILSHSAYHRGQLAYILRMNTLEPPKTDFIKTSP